MSKDTIDRATYDALQTKVAEHMRKQGDGIYETPLPADLRAQMDALGLNFGDNGALVDKSGKAIVFEAQKADEGLGDNGAPSAPVLDTTIVTEQELDNVNELDEAVSANSNPQQNKNSYSRLTEAVNKHSAGDMTLEDLLAVMTELGANNTQSPFQAHLACIKAAVNHPNKEEGKAALGVINKNFAFLGDETSKQGLLETLTAAKNICESNKVAQDIKLGVEKGIADLEVEAKDKSPQQDKSKEETIAKEKTEGNKLNTAKKIIKYGAALGLAVGFPPFGLIAAVALLCVARNWGEAKKNKGEQSELEKNQETLRNANQRLADAKNKRSAQANQALSGEEEGLEDDGKGSVLEGKENEGGTPSADKTKAAVAQVAEDAKQDVKDSGNKLANAGKESEASAPDDDVQQRNHQQQIADELAAKKASEVGVDAGGYVEVLPEGELNDDGDKDKDKNKKPQEHEGSSQAAPSVATQDNLDNDQNNHDSDGYLEVEAQSPENVGNNSVQESLNAARKLAQGEVLAANIEAAKEQAKADSQPQPEATPEAKKQERAQ